MTTVPYQPPGVYVDDVSQDVITALNPGLPEALLCIVAPALGYQTASDTIQIFSGTDAALTNPNVAQDSSLVVTTLDGVTTLVKNTDYSVSVDSTGAQPVTKIRRLPSTAGTPSPAGIVDGQQVLVTYRYTSSDYFQPKAFDDYTSLSQFYGPSLSAVSGSANPIVSPLTLAARVAFENGASRIIGVAVAPPTNPKTWRDQFKGAYDMLVTDDRISVVVPVFPESDADSGTELQGLLADLRLHCSTAASNGCGRMALASGAAAYNESTTGFDTVAKSVANKRVVLVYPTRMQMFNQATNATIEVGGGYLAAALGGRLLYNDAAQGLTRQPVGSFTDIPPSVKQKMTLAFMNTLGGSGVCVVMPNRTGSLVVRDGCTTDPSYLTTSEIALVRVADKILLDVQVGMDNNGLIGQPITADLLMAIKGGLLNILEQEVADGTINGYTNVAVRQQATPVGNPSVVECTFAYQPSIPLHYITVTFSMDLTTGNLDTTTTA